MQNSKLGHLYYSFFKQKTQDLGLSIIHIKHILQEHKQVKSAGKQQVPSMALIKAPQI